jgi:hypothetical protein
MVTPVPAVSLPRAGEPAVPPASAHSAVRKGALGPRFVGASPYHRHMRPSEHREAPRATPGLLPGLYQLRGPSVSCVVCRGPLRPGYARCYQCTQQRLLGDGLLADAVAPLSYAVRGTPFAIALAQYKSGDRRAAESLLALLLAFLRDHGPCVWRSAGMPQPGRLAVVPSGCGRPGSHPLLRMVAPRLPMPLIPLAIRHGEQGRDLNACRFAAGPAGGADVLLLDDTWVSGASAQSAAVALKRAGAARVAIIVIGRHLNPAEPRSAALAIEPYDPGICVFHDQQLGNTTPFIALGK